MDHHDLSPSIQDYAKEIYVLQEPGRPVGTSALAERLGVSAPSVSEMIRTLVDRGLVTHEPYHGIKLTPEGVKVALGVIRHHRLLELFLAESLGLPWDEIHKEAEALEHAISEELEEKIASRLGDPQLNPYGEPIPSREGTIETTQATSLADLEPGQAGTFVEIPHPEPSVLGALEERHIHIGDRVELVEKAPEGPVRVRVGGRKHEIDQTMAGAMRVLVER
jgi:DtxR family Mn-dependent transcriptional regulator